jgi:hypothetical protein
MKKLIILFIFFFSIGCQPNANATTEIKSINTIVLHIDKTKGDLSALELKLHTGEFEAVPPEVMYYYKPENMELVMLQVSVGHEIFSTKHTYYLNNNRVIKYLKETFDHPDSPPQKVIIYDVNGKVLWKNIDEPAVSTVDVIKLFKQNINTLKAFSKY